MGDILIHGMEMPGNCRVCPLRASCLHLALTVCNYTEERPFDCPLPRRGPPHGRLGDVADVKELFEKHFGDDEIAFQLIDSVPVIIPPKSKEQQDQEDLVERLNREGIAP